MPNEVEQKITRLIELWKDEGTASIVRRIFGRLQKQTPPLILCHMDHPANDQLQGLELEIYGWAASLAAKVERIEAFVDDELMGDIKYGLARPDVLDAYPDLLSEKLGFGSIFLLSEKPGQQRRKILVRVHDSEGNKVEVRRWINITSKPADKITVPNFNFSNLWTDERPTLERSSVSVVIPTLNAGDDLPVLLSSLKSQEGCESIQIIVVDSGSRDGTVELSRSYGANVIKIAPEDFSHSTARNLGAESATGNYLLFMTQDALPGSRHFLYEMIQVARASGVVAVTPTEAPREDVDLFYRVTSWGHNRFLGLVGGDRITGQPPSSDYVTIRRHCQLNNVACLIDREVFERYRFRNDYAEDLDMGMRLTTDGHKLAMLSSTRVIHSHNRPAYYYLRRGYVDTICLARMFSDFPLPPNLNQPELRNEILSSYWQLNRIITALEKEVTLPCTVSDFLTAVKSHWKSQLNAEGSATGASTYRLSCVDQNYSDFLSRLMVNGSVAESPATATKQVALPLDNLIWQIKEYISSVYESVDDGLFSEFKQAIFKAHALASGTMLASHFISSPPNNEASTRLELELRQGV
jgi:glycosyltransferase involved in cell wall biosynthesis